MLVGTVIKTFTQFFLKMKTDKTTEVLTGLLNIA